MRERKQIVCPDCRDEMPRRQFVKTAGAAIVAASAAPLAARHCLAAPTPSSSAETNVQRLYESLSVELKKAICLPFDHQKRTRISANWHITDVKVGDDFFSNEQRQLIDDVLRGVTSQDGYERLLKQMDDDDGGVSAYSIAIFGQPGSGKFEWAMTGRHLTIRADGDSVDNAAFGGPVIYGHGESEPADNLFHYQTKKANEVFAALDAEQRKKALLPSAPSESSVAIQGTNGEFPGLAVGELSSDQKDLVESVVKVILAPYREEDVEEAIAVLKAGGGFEKLHMAFYQQGDLKDDKVWDIWRVEGPSFVWHFRGAPHVHAYVNIGLKG